MIAAGPYSLRRFLGRLWRVRREVLWVISGHLIGFVGGFAGIKLLTNLMGAEGYGELALGLTIAGLVNVFAYGPLNQWVLRYWSIHREREDLGQYFFVLRHFSAFITSVVVIVAVLATVVMQALSGKQWALLVLAASLFGISSGINGTFFAIQNANRQRRVVALHQGAEAWLRPVMAAVALYFFGNNGYAALSGFLLGTLIITLSQALFATRDVSIRRHWQGNTIGEMDWIRVRRGFLDYVSPFGYYALFGTITLYADRWALQGWFGERQVGIYVALYQIANAPTTFLVAMISQLMAPIIFDRSGATSNGAQARSATQLLRTTVGVTVALMSLVTVIAYTYGFELVAALTASEFTEEQNVLWVLVAGLSVFNIAQLLSIRGFSAQQTRIYVVPKALHACTFLIFLYFLTRHYMVFGTALALVLSSLVYLIAVFWANRSLRV